MTDQVLAAYVEARMMNGTPQEECARWRYYRGWYRIGAFRYRERQLRQLTANLLGRAARPAAPDGKGDAR